MPQRVTSRTLEHGLATPADIAQPRRMADFSEALSQLTEVTDQALDQVADHNAATPTAAVSRTCFLGWASTRVSACRNADRKVT